MPTVPAGLQVRRRRRRERSACAWHILGDLACDVLHGRVQPPVSPGCTSQGLINGTFDSAYDLLPGAAYVFCRRRQQRSRGRAAGRSG